MVEMSDQPSNDPYFRRCWDGFSVTMDVISWVNFVVGLFMIFVMYKMRIYESRILGMILHLFILQTIYVTSFMSQINPDPFSSKYVLNNPFYPARVAYAFATSVDGGFVTNFITFTLLFVVLTGKAAQPNSLLYTFLITVPGLAVGIPTCMMYVQENYEGIVVVTYIYEVIRMVQVSANFLAVVVLYYRVHELSGGSWFGSSDSITTEVAALRSLAFRLIGYPLVGTIQRLSCALYAFYADSSYTSFLYVVEAMEADPHKSTTVLILFMYIWGVFAPSSIVMDTAIFLYFQEGALDTCKYYLRCAASVLTFGYVQQGSIPSVLMPPEERQRVPDVKSVLDRESIAEFGEMNPNELMSIIVEQRASKTFPGSMGHGVEAYRDDSVMSASTVASVPRGSSFALLDYILDTSDEPGVSPQEATSKRRNIRREMLSNQRSSQPRASARLSNPPSLPEVTANPITEEL